MPGSRFGCQAASMPIIRGDLGITSHNFVEGGSLYERGHAAIVRGRRVDEMAGSSRSHDECHHHTHSEATSLATTTPAQARNPSLQFRYRLRSTSRSHTDRRPTARPLRDNLLRVGGTPQSHDLRPCTCEGNDAHTSCFSFLTDSFVACWMCFRAAWIKGASLAASPRGLEPQPIGEPATGRLSADSPGRSSALFCRGQEHCNLHGGKRS